MSACTSWKAFAVLFLIVLMTLGWLFYFCRSSMMSGWLVFFRRRLMKKKVAKNDAYTQCFQTRRGEH